MLKDAMAFYSAIEGKVRDTVRAMSGKNLQCERYDVTTAPNGTTGKIGVTQPFGNEIFVPYSAACANAAVGDTVLVVWWKSLSNAKAWFMGDAIGEGGGGGGGAVTSVNGQTGAVELDAADVGALPVHFSATISSLPLTISDARILADTSTEESRVADVELGTPSALTSALSWTTAGGSVTFSGTLTSGGSTTIEFDIIRVEKQ